MSDPNAQTPYEDDLYKHIVNLKALKATGKISFYTMSRIETLEERGHIRVIRQPNGDFLTAEVLSAGDVWAAQYERDKEG